MGRHGERDGKRARTAFEVAAVEKATAAAMETAVESATTMESRVRAFACGHRAPVDRRAHFTHPHGCHIRLRHSGASHLACDSSALRRLLYGHGPDAGRAVRVLPIRRPAQPIPLSE